MVIDILGDDIHKFLHKNWLFFLFLFVLFMVLIGIGLWYFEVLRFIFVQETRLILLSIAVESFINDIFKALHVLEMIIIVVDC